MVSKYINTCPVASAVHKVLQEAEHDGTCITCLSPTSPLLNVREISGLQEIKTHGHLNSSKQTGTSGEDGARESIITLTQQ